MRYFYLIILTLVLLLPVGVLAFTETTTGGNVYSQVEPQDLVPNQEVNITLSSYDVDLDRSQIVWSVNSQTISSNLGIKHFSFKLGGENTPSIVKILIKSPSGQIIEKVLNFRPSTIDLLWQAETYTPTLYQGKALPSLGSKIKILALPNLVVSGKKTDSKQLVFKWYKNNNFLSDSSGAGKDFITIKLDNLISQTNIKVEASTLNGDGAVGSTTIRVVNPQIIIYPYSASSTPNRAFSSSIRSNNSNASLVAEPFYFSLDDLINQAVTFQWFRGDKLLANTPNFAITNSKEGSIPLTIVVSNQNSLLQKAVKNVTLFLNPNNDRSSF